MTVNMLTMPTTKAQRYRYSSYGKTTLEKDNGSTDHTFIENLFAYTGREYDIDTELYGYRSRYYSPELGRFISRDKIWPKGGLNGYDYANGNPLIHSDPTGEDVAAFKNCVHASGLIFQGRQKQQFDQALARLDSTVASYNAAKGATATCEAGAAVVAGAVVNTLYLATQAAVEVSFFLVGGGAYCTTYLR